MRSVFIVLAAFAALALIPMNADAGYLESFKKEFVYQPWAGGQVGEESACLLCHTSENMKPRYLKIPVEWKQSWHYKNDVSCHDCHGGDVGDATLSMSHQRGFVGKPEFGDVPGFCGKCHIGILDAYNQSGHGKVFFATGDGPNCLTCHGSHNIQKASISIINEQLCTQCHSYDRAMEMRQALFLVEGQIVDIDNALARLKDQGVSVKEQEKKFFNTQAEFRTLFHAIDVELVKEQSSGFTERLDVIEGELQNMFGELAFRRNFSAFLFLLFAGLCVVVFFISKEPKD